MYGLRRLGDFNRVGQGNCREGSETPALGCSGHHEGACEILEVDSYELVRALPWV